MTIGELRILYQDNHVVNLKSRRNISRRLQYYIAPFDAISLDELTKMQVVVWHQQIGRTRGLTAANQALGQLHALYRKAQDWQVYDGHNPAERVKQFRKQSRERFVQSNEMPSLLRSLARARPKVETLFLCLLLTGARVGEACAMQWKHLDLERALWHKPTTKSGVPHTIPLPAHLVVLLHKLPRVTDWVFSSNPSSQNGMRAGQWSRTAVRYAWERIRRRAGLPDVRIHDLRRTAASWLAINGSNMHVIQSMLNHTSLSSTQIYARLNVEPVRLALDDQATRILGAVPGPVTRPLEEDSALGTGDPHADRLNTSSEAQQVADLPVSYAVPGREGRQALSTREREVFSLLSEGRSVQDIAQSLALSSKTVSTYRARLLDKLQLRRTTEPIRFPLLDGSRNVGVPTPPTALSHNGSWFDNTAPSCRVGEREEWPG